MEEEGGDERRGMKKYRERRVVKGAAGERRGGVKKRNSRQEERETGRVLWVQELQSKGRIVERRPRSRRPRTAAETGAMLRSARDRARARFGVRKSMTATGADGSWIGRGGKKERTRQGWEGGTAGGGSQKRAAL